MKIDGAFLNEVSALRSQYPHEAFNLFAVLRGRSDEVRLHSRFIGELLDPSGSHGMGRALLDVFLKLIGEDPQQIHNPTIRREWKRIDLCIESDERIVVVENKVFARDQDGQLDRYYEEARKRRQVVVLVYLTLDGKLPSGDSLGGLRPDVIENRLNCVSYEQDLVSWLERGIELVGDREHLRSSLCQYLELVKEITGCLLYTSPSPRDS